jgi:hypothetical protein
VGAQTPWSDKGQVAGEPLALHKRCSAPRDWYGQVSVP